MVDIKAKEKLRNKVNKVVEQRMKATGAKDEKLVRIEINKEMRAKKKEKKASNHEEVEKIKIEVMKTMGKINICCWNTYLFPCFQLERVRK